MWLEVRKRVPLLLGVQKAATGEVLPVADRLVTIRVDRVSGLDGSKLLSRMLRIAVLPMSWRLLRDLVLMRRDAAAAIS